MSMLAATVQLRLLIFARRRCHEPAGWIIRLSFLLHAIDPRYCSRPTAPRLLAHYMASEEFRTETEERRLVFVGRIVSAPCHPTSRAHEGSDEAVSSTVKRTPHLRVRGRSASHLPSAVHCASYSSLRNGLSIGSLYIQPGYISVMTNLKKP